MKALRGVGAGASWFDSSPFRQAHHEAISSVSVRLQGIWPDYLTAVIWKAMRSLKTTVTLSPGLSVASAACPSADLIHGVRWTRPPFGSTMSSFLAAMSVRTTMPLTDH